MCDDKYLDVIIKIGQILNKQNFIKINGVLIYNISCYECAGNSVFFENQEENITTSIDYKDIKIVSNEL